MTKSRTADDERFARLFAKFEAATADCVTTLLRGDTEDAGIPEVCRILSLVLAFQSGLTIAVMADVIDPGGSVGDLRDRLSAAAGRMIGYGAAVEQPKSRFSYDFNTLLEVKPDGK